MVSPRSEVSSAVFSATRGRPVRPVMSGAWTGPLGAVTSRGVTGPQWSAGSEAELPPQLLKVEWKNESFFCKINFYLLSHIVLSPDSCISVCLLPLFL